MDFGTVVISKVLCTFFVNNIFFHFVEKGNAWTRVEVKHQWSEREFEDIGQGLWREQDI